MSRYLRDESGAVAVIVAVFIASIAIILAAIVIDLGGLWSSQRALVTDTDAAALAGAVELAENWMETGDCTEGLAETEASRVLKLNNPDDEIIGTSAECRIQDRDFTGQVQMTARQRSPGFFSGRDDLSAGGTTTATFELQLGETQGLAVCQNLFTSDFPRDAKDDFVVGEYLLFPYKFAEKTLDESVKSCKVIPSNTGAPFTAGGWGWLDGTCDLDEDALATWCDADTGTDDLKKFLGGREGDTIDFPIFEQARDVGSNAEYQIVGRVKATLVGACGSGSGPFDPDEDCKLPPTGKLQGQPGFVVVTDWDVTFFGDLTSTKFRDATYSICDVDGSGDYCP